MLNNEIENHMDLKEKQWYYLVKGIFMKKIMIASSLLLTIGLG